MGPILALFILFSIPMGCFSQACRAVNQFPKVPENNEIGYNVTELIVDPGHTVEVTSHYFEIIGSYLTLKISVDYEALPVNSAIGPAIIAYDADQDIIYYVLSGYDTNAAAYFKLASDTNPVILVSKSLNYDIYPIITLNLTARDTEDPADAIDHTDTVVITITIIDADDKPPFFLPCKPQLEQKSCFNSGYKSSVNRTEQAKEPLHLTPGPLYAVDGDFSINAPIDYSIVSGNDDVFVVHSNGNITMNRSIDTLGTIILQVMAFQTNDFSKYATTTVQIEVKERNNFPPIFQVPNYFGSIALPSERNSFVRDSNNPNNPLQVFAEDGDFPDKVNPAVIYKIENSSDFTVLRDGYILTNTVITSPGTIVVLVTATDSTTAEVASTIVTVEVIPATTTAPTTTSTTTTTRASTTVTNTPRTGSPTTFRTGPTPSVTPLRSTTTGTGTITSTTRSTQTTTSTTTGTGTTTTATPSTQTTTSTTTGTGTTISTSPSTRTTTSTTTGTGTTISTSPSTLTTTSTTTGTGTTTTATSSTQTTTSTTTGTGTTISTSPSTQTTTSTTTGTGTTTTSTPSTQTTTSTTTGTGTTTTATPSTPTTTSTTTGTGTTTTATPSTQTTTSTTTGTGTTISTSPSTQTTTSTTTGTGTTISTSPSTLTTTSTTTGTGTTTSTSPSTLTTTSTTTRTGTTTSTSPSTLTTTSTTTRTGTTTSTSPSTLTTTSTTTGTATDDVSQADKYYTATDMAALGASLAVILVLCLIGLGYLINKQYGNAIKEKLGKNDGYNSGGSDYNTELMNDGDSANITMPTNLDSDNGGVSNERPITSSMYLGSAAALSPILSSTSTDNLPSETAENESDSDDTKVKSILTKDLKEDVGYKSVWFREDAAPEVVVIEGVEDGEADDEDDDDTEEQRNDFNDNFDFDEDEDQDLDPTFNVINNDSNFTTL
ncbi:cadherin-related family member 5 [Mixophyes fleayi]|uniref:cadherin-related family member 5 n=1 Tax=Mixophyes fleayi TaxID=3061075 RepID=UPI003F4E358A